MEVDMEINPTVWRKYKKQSIPNLMNLLWWKVNIKCFGFNNPFSGIYDVEKCCLNSNGC